MLINEDGLFLQVKFRLILRPGTWAFMLFTTIKILYVLSDRVDIVTTVLGENLDSNQ